VNLDRTREIFAENFLSRREVGASLSVWHKGAEILSLHEGFADRARLRPWTSSTPVLIWSATKGLAAACVLHSLSATNLGLETRVSDFWPEFAAKGKGHHTVADVLSHRGGLAALDHDVSVFDYEAVINALADQAPNWKLGESHGYHPRTFGFLADEMVRRISGKTLGEYWTMNFAEPLDLKIWIGLDRDRDIAEMIPPRNIAQDRDREFQRALSDPQSLTARAFRSPRGLHRPAEMNSAAARAASFPAFGGIATASSLAKFYASLASAHDESIFPGAMLAAVVDARVNGFDKILQMNTAFAAGFMKDFVNENGDKPHPIFGPSTSAFGHPGAGGSLAFADPENEIGFAYVMNQMDPGIMPGDKPLRLVEALYA
jgi:CubicO group peptidase (beta-lactamase class C family)